MLSLVKRLFGSKRRGQPPVRRSAAHFTLGARNGAGFPTLKPSSVDLFDNPDLKLDTPPDTGFDPYNTGTFDRSGSWERVNKRRND